MVQSFDDVTEACYTEPLEGRNEMADTSRFQAVIDNVETLPPEDQEALVDLIRKRLIEHRRAEIAANIALTRQEYRNGQVRRGTAEDLLAGLDN